MKLALTSVIGIGIAIGFSLPGGRPRAAVTPAPVAGSHETVLARSASGHFIAVADVNHAETRFLVDTGADTVALTQDDARRAHVDFDPSRFVVVGSGASGPVRGEPVRIDSIVLDGKPAFDVGGVVLENADVSLLGQSYLRHLDHVGIEGDTMTLR